MTAAAAPAASKPPLPPPVAQARSSRPPPAPAEPQAPPPSNRASTPDRGPPDAPHRDSHREIPSREPAVRPRSDSGTASRRPPSSSSSAAASAAELEARSRAVISAAAQRSARAGQTAAERAVAAKSARHAEAFFCRWAHARLEMDGHGDVGALAPSGGGSGGGGGGGGGNGDKSGGGPGASVAGHEWGDGERVSALVLSLFGEAEPAAVRLKRWKGGALRVQKVARVVACLAVLDERSPPDLTLQGEGATADHVVDGCVAMTRPSCVCITFVRWMWCKLVTSLVPAHGLPPPSLSIVFLSPSFYLSLFV